MLRQGWLTVALLLAFFAPSYAQEVQWQQNFAAAQAQAKEQQRPMLLDFGTTNCTWCRRLEATTFRDPAVMKTLAERFITVKIDAERDPQLTQSYGVNAFPTLVFLSPEGRVIGKQEGYVEAPRFSLQLERAIRESGPPPEKPMLLTRRTLPVAIADAKRVREAGRLLAVAQDDYRAGQYVLSLERCKQIIVGYSDTPAEPEAQRLAADIKADPEKSRQVRVGLSNTLAEIYLTGAETAVKEGRLHAAEALLERVQQCCPESPYAGTATEMLNRLRTKPATEAAPGK